MGRVLLLRHAETPWNGARRWQGWAEVSLSTLGREQAHAVGLRLRALEIDVIWSSDLRRALDTADIISGAIGVTPVNQDPGLRERDVGEWMGLTDDEIEGRWPGALAAWRSKTLDRPPGGEATADVFSRASRVLEKLLEQDLVVLAVTHAGVIHEIERTLGLHLGGVPNLGGRWIERGMTAGPSFVTADSASQSEERL